MDQQTIGFVMSFVCAGLSLFWVRRPETWGRSLAKTAAVGGLAAVTAQEMPLLALAFAASALGDLALSRPGERAFLAGVASFAVAHVVFAAVFLGLPGAEPAAVLAGGRGLVLLGLLALGGAVARLLYLRAGALRWATVAYVPVILGMSAAALAVPNPAIWLGAALFLASDLTLAVETFLLDRDNPGRRFTAPAVWSLYWAAQAVFFLSLTG